MVEQGLSFTVIETPHPMEGDPATFDARQDFYIARRIWFGSTDGTDWLHSQIEAELGEEVVHYLVESRRDSSHIGAAGEIATVVLIFLGVGGWSYLKAFGGRLGEGHAEVLLDWSRERARERRRERGLERADGPPDFSSREVDDIARGMKAELAKLVGVPEDRFDLLRAERGEANSTTAVYRDTKTETDYEVVAKGDHASFKRLGAPDPPQPKAKRTTRAKGLFRRRRRRK